MYVHNYVITYFTYIASSQVCLGFFQGDWEAFAPLALACPLGNFSCEDMFLKVLMP